MNLTTNKWNSKRMGVNKYTVEKTHIQKNSSLQKNQYKWKLKSSTMYILVRKRDNKHIM